MLARRELGTDRERGGERERERLRGGGALNSFKHSKESLNRKSDLWRSTSFQNCGSGLIPPGPGLNAGLWLETSVVSLHSGSLEHSSSLSWGRTIRCLAIKWPLSSVFNSNLGLPIAMVVFQMTLTLNFVWFCQFNLTANLCIICWSCWHFTINSLTLVLPCLPWLETCFSIQGYEAQRRDLDLLTSTNTRQQSYLPKLAQRGKEPLTAESCTKKSEWMKKKERTTIILSVTLH